MVIELEKSKPMNFRFVPARNDAIVLSEHEHFQNLKPNAVQLYEDTEDGEKNPSIHRVLSVTHYEPAHPKWYYADKFPGYNPPSLVFNPAADIHAYAQSMGKSNEPPLISHQVFGKSLDRFVKEQLLPFVQEHKDVYIKDAEGGGGHNIARLQIRQGHLVLTSTNENFMRFMRHAQSGIRYLHGSKLQPKRRETIGQTMRDVLADLPPDSTSTKHPLISKPMSLGPVHSIHPEMMQALCGNLSNFMLGLQQKSVVLVAQKAIEHLKDRGLQGNPVEFRMFLQRRGNGTYGVVHHYAKIGGRPIASNVGQGGRVTQSRVTLMGILEKAFPKSSVLDRKKMVKKFFKKAREMSQQIMNAEPIYQRGVTIPVKEIKSEEEAMDDLLKKSPQFELLTDEQLEALIRKAIDSRTSRVWNLDVKAPPILSTVDLVARITPNGIEPTVMEHHGAANFGMLEDFEKGLIPVRTWKQMMRRHERNISWIYREARKQLYPASARRNGVQKEVQNA